MNTLSERLAELSGKATGGPWQCSQDGTGDLFISGAGGAYIMEIGCPDDDAAEADAALSVELVNAYRTGRLIVKED